MHHLIVHQLSGNAFSRPVNQRWRQMETHLLHLTSRRSLDPKSITANDQQCHCKAARMVILKLAQVDHTAKAFLIV